MQDREFQEFRTTRVTGGGYKGIPNRLKQSRPGKLCVFTLYTIRCCFCQTGVSSCHAYVMYVRVPIPSGSGDI